MKMTTAHRDLARKLADPKRLEKLVDALERGQPPWTVGVVEPEELVRETLGFMGVVIDAKPAGN